jgi:predicted aspartyl protease
MTLAILLLAALLANPPLAPQQPAVTRFEAVSQPQPSDIANSPDQFAFGSDSYDRMTVPVRLGAAGPFRFLVDTGSDRTAISRELAAKLGLAPASHALLHSATGQSHVAMAVIPNLSLSRKAIRRIDAPLLAAADMGADGILGIDSLRSHRVQFDFRARTLSITSAEGPISRDEADAIVVRAQRREGRLVVTDARAAGQHVSVVIDSGSQLSVGNEALRRKLESRGGVHSIGPTDLISVTGAVLRGELVTIDELEIGGVTLHNLVLVFADAHTFRQLRLDRAPALLLGMNGLRSFDRVSLDFASRKLRLVLPRDSVGGRAGSADSNLR